MIYGFGHTLAVVPYDEQRLHDPSRPDPRAVAEMRAFDALPRQMRERIAGGRYGCMVADIARLVQQRGCPKDLRERILARGAVPCTEEVIVEQVAVLEDAESERLQREAATETSRSGGAQSARAAILRRQLGLG